ncbi:hypothetical protein SNOG_11260 [Parastagonospora nodorum SN15]|uniref:Uncharacterized protein n=1 Tax=Phaeosphaeria nodorum (strain SN15 / ATCC MYA-4574 / FGSC 10173) TaxID=321614 RepID=Q0UAF4_PHANO|nr:hypothetical protein SNOG_11260 [Parastagonospora nodorum SN15]EAT81759.1 hypothetical protein SNOG_11260 [Parastagonospora nodorum SN15]
MDDMAQQQRPLENSYWRSLPGAEPRGAWLQREYPPPSLGP